MEINNSNSKFSYYSTPHAMASKSGKPKYREEAGKAKFSKSADFGYVPRGNSGAASKANFKGRGAKPAPVVYELEELTDRPIDNQENDVDVDFSSSMYNEANLPKFVKAVETQDMQTQIERNDHHLFDFDVEVRPILEVLVGKTIHIAVIELKEEAEMEEIERKEEEFEITRCVELAELQRLEADIKRKTMEKLRRRDQEALRLVQEAELALGVTVQNQHNELERQQAILDADTTAKDKMALRSLQNEIERDFLRKVMINTLGGTDAYESASILAEEILSRSMELAEEFEYESLRLREIRDKKILKAEQKRERLAMTPAEIAISQLRQAARDPDMRPGGSSNGEGEGPAIKLRDLFKEYDQDG